MNYKHLSIEEREKIQKYLWQKQSLHWIAKKIGRSVSSVSRELKRNCPKRRKYTPRKAHERALVKRTSRGRKDRLKTTAICTYVTEHLKEGWSPEQIAGRMKRDKIGTISHEAIYQFVYNQIHRNGWGSLRPGAEDLRIFLRRKKKRRTQKGMRRSQRIWKNKGLSIDLRPKLVEQKKRIGDFEGDTVESCNHKPGVNTLLERKSGMFFVTKVADKTADATVRAVESRMREVPKHLKHTLTLDNGTENSNWILFETKTGLQVFYAHPYRSSERGANENANGLLREYFPKKTDFSMISDEEIAAVELRMNSRPRKRLGWRTPLEVWSVALRG